MGRGRLWIWGPGGIGGLGRSLGLGLGRRCWGLRRCRGGGSGGGRPWAFFTLEGGLGC